MQDLNIKYHKGILMITVENSYNSELKIKEGRFLTTKDQNEDRNIDVMIGERGGGSDEFTN